MRQFQYIPVRQEIVHPKCAKCGSPIWLAHIEHDKPGYDRRTFECVECENSINEIVKYR
jgi:hypothetical protein